MVALLLKNPTITILPLSENAAVLIQLFVSIVNRLIPLVISLITMELCFCRLSQNSSSTFSLSCEKEAMVHVINT